MARHKLTEREKFQRKADRINAKQRAEMPLFADQVETTSGEVEYWRWRYNKARSVEGTVEAHHLLDMLTEHCLRRLAAPHLGLILLDRLTVYRQNTYPPSPEYRISFWKKVLVGGQVVFSWKRVEVNGKVRVEPEGVFPPAGWKAPFTWEQLDQRLPPDRWAEKPALATDDGLAALVDAVLRKNAKRSA